MSRKLIGSILIVLMIGNVQAQTQTNDNFQKLYVTDQLRLSLYEQADQRSKVIQLLSSGDKLLVDEIAGPYANVLTPQGNRGWVKRGFLVSDPTAGLLLVEMEKENKNLTQELERLANSKAVIDQYESDMNAMNEKLQSLEGEKENAQQTIIDLRKQAEQKIQQEKAKPALAMLINMATIYWQYIALGCAIIVLLGFFVGKSVTQSSIRRKFHGIKVW